MAIWARCWQNGNEGGEGEGNLTATRLAFEACNSWNLKGATSQTQVVHECD